MGNGREGGEPELHLQPIINDKYSQCCKSLREIKLPQHPFHQPRGRLVSLEVSSKALAANLCGDPDSRTVAIYLPEDYDRTKQQYPLLVGLAGFTGSGLMHVGWKAFQENIPQRVERLISEGKMGPAILAFPDCFTSLGGNQYINSTALGQWEDFLRDDLLPALAREFRILPGASHRAVFGKSSGGYGALVQGMLHADTWAAVACHSGDMGFELCYRGDMPGLLRTLQASDNDIGAFVNNLHAGRKMTGGGMHQLMTLAMAASYDPDPSAPFGIRLPVSEDTCELLPERWENWQAWDPVRMIDRQEVQDNLRSLKGLFIDCGTKDQYNLVYGARQLVKKLQGYAIQHQYEEFPDNHSSVDYRMDVSLPWLYGVIKDS